MPEPVPAGVGARGPPVLAALVLLQEGELHLVASGQHRRLSMLGKMPRHLDELQLLLGGELQQGGVRLQLAEVVGPVPGVLGIP